MKMNKLIPMYTFLSSFKQKMTARPEVEAYSMHRPTIMIGGTDFNRSRTPVVAYLLGQTGRRVQIILYFLIF